MATILPNLVDRAVSGNWKLKYLQEVGCHRCMKETVVELKGHASPKENYIENDNIVNIVFVY